METGRKTRKGVAIAFGTMALGLVLFPSPGSAGDPTLSWEDVLARIHGDCTGFAAIGRPVEVAGSLVGVESGLATNTDFGNQGLFFRFAHRDLGDGYLVYWMDGSTHDGRCVDRGAAFPADEWLQYNGCLLGGSLNDQGIPPSAFCMYDPPME